MNVELSRLWIYLLLGLFFFFIASQVVGFSADLTGMIDSFFEFVRSL